MSGFLIFVIIICVLFLTVSWILPMIISWHFEKKYDVSLKIGRIGLPYLKICDISLSKNGFSIHVDEIGIKSSFLNSELTKLITLMVKDVRINKDLSPKKEGVVDNSSEASTLVDFRDTKVPHFITSFAQFMAVHVYNVSAMLLRSETPGYLIHATASELHLDGSILKNAKSLLVTINLMDAETKILRHAEQHAKETRLAEFSFGISMETILVAQGPLSVEKLDLKMSNTSAVIKGGFYNLTQSSGSKQVIQPFRSNMPSCEDDIFQRIKPLIPKNCSLYIDETALTGVKDNSQIEYSSSLKSLALIYRSVPLEDKNSSDDLSILFNFYMTDLLLQNSREKLLEMRHLNIDAKLKHYVLNIYLQQNCLQVTYDHNLIHKWVCTNFPKSPQKIPIMKMKAAHKCEELGNNDLEMAKTRTSSALEKVIEKLSISFCAELCQVLAVVRLKDQNSAIGFSRVRLLLDKSHEKRGATFKSYLINLLLRDHHFTMEFSVESLWWSFKEWSQDKNVSKGMHIWGTPLYLGMGVIKISSTESQEIDLESLLDIVQLEWSLEFAEYVLLALSCIKQYRRITQPKLSTTAGKKTNENFPNISSHLMITHFNLFMQAQNEEYFVCRMNSVSLDKTLDAVNLKFEGFKVFSLKDSGDYYSCIRSEDIDNYKVFIKTIVVDIRDNREKSKETTIALLETVVMFWSTNFHLKSVLLARDMKEFLAAVKHELGIKSDKQIKERHVTNFNVFGKLELHIEISPIHNAKVSLDELTISRKLENVKEPCDICINTSVEISIDDTDIFTIKGIYIRRIKSHPIIEAERMDAENFILKFNKTYSISIDLFKAIFPHEHNFAEAVQNQFMSVTKWLKIIHNLKEDKTQGTLPSDLMIEVKEFLFEMSDDPFEVKLRDNFELLEDEYNESLKRQKMLKDKIGDLLKTHLHMPAGKVEELYATLKKKNAEIYVQRSKLMYKASPPRTRLFAWNMANVEVLILADPSIHGPEKVIQKMREIDSNSPWPEESMEFSTLWCRVISFKCAEWKFQLRDFPQPLMCIRKCYLCGQLVGAEQVAPKRAIRTVEVHLGEPFEPFVIERGMLPLKYYHDFNCEVDYFSYAFGPCWEPVIAQCNLSFNQISAPSRDPSPPLPFWDKMRLKLHGRLTMVIQQLSLLLHASLDPYNTTEEMALTWEKVVMDWTNAKYVFKGDLSVFVRTASKYDDVQLLKMPNLKLVLGINWVCLGHPNDHHNVILCAPDKVPEYSINQVHDSFRAFRSQNVNLNIVLETRPVQNEPNSCPILLLYGSTLRWIESLKLIFSSVTRPTKRGRIFNNIRPRKVQLSRLYKKVHLLIGLHKFQVCYWMSFSMQRGCELFGGRLSSSSEHTLSLVNIDDGLKHRPKAEWSVVYMNSELNDFEIWLKSALHDEQEAEVPSPRQPVEKCYFLSVAKVSYGRETVVACHERNKDIPIHRLVVYDLKGAWTKSNRNVAYSLFDTFMKSTRLKKNLSTEALKGFRKNSTTPLKRRNNDPSSTPPNPSKQAIQSSTAVQDTPSPISKLQSGHAANMLQQLIAEADNNAVVYSDDLSAVSRQQHLQGLQACQEDDVQYKNWQIALVNAQMLLKGCETKGYIIMSAAKAEIVQSIHRPAWKDRTLVTKTTWVGTLECMQYYATVNARDNDTVDENIMWLTVDNIQEKESTEISEPSEVPNMVGSGVSVGAVVSDIVGPSCSRQLQRIVSRCKCEFFYANYGDISVDPKGIAEIPPPPQEEVSPWESKESAVDAFTLMHYDLDVCTNSLQYAMLLDIVNNLLLYVEPHKKEALEKLARMRFKLQLHSVEDQRKPIQNQQTLVRSTQSKLKRLEKETYLVNKALEENPDDIELRQESCRLERLMYDCKNQLGSQSEELDMMLSCYKEMQLLANARLATTRSDKPLNVVRANEICFKHAQWRLTEADGQIGIADLVLSNFLYTKNSKSDDSVEHLLELGYLRMTNLLPNEIYNEVICPTEIQFDMPIEHKKVLRIFCREKPPVGGISVKEIFEINLVPLTIGLTKKFYGIMMKFCFPERDTENNDYSDRASEDGEADQKGKKIKSKRNRDSNFYVHIDDVEKMKERAEKNKLFVYIKIPEVPVKVSYKGPKEKNLEDLRDYSLVIPTLEYHNMTWTWLDLLMAIRNDSKRVILSQAIKQKLQIKRKTGSSDESSTPQEEDKARMLFGARHAPENRSIRKGVSGVFRLGK